MVDITDQQQREHNVRLYDLGNTLIRMDHTSYVFGRDPSLRTHYESGYHQANIVYEQILEEGLRQGEVQVSVLPRVAEHLAADLERGLRNAVFSTCTAGAIEAVLQHLELSPYVGQTFSTFDVNDDSVLLAQRSAATKTARGFQRVNAALGGAVISYADDKLEELARARQGLGDEVALYWIKKRDEAGYSPVQGHQITGVIGSIADICQGAGLRIVQELRPKRIRQGV